MKYGANFERESVPGWRFHNIDYNSLKHYIKVHTTKGQATAIAIPGHTDSALVKVEDELYLELSRQHDRVGLFVASKADEISRRLQHLQTQTHRFIKKQEQIATKGANDDNTSPLKRQRRLGKLESDVVSCGDEIADLQRFVKAQNMAFRKILKKYKKWTGSTTLGIRFKGDVLSHTKSFVRRDFHRQLQQTYDELLALTAEATRVLESCQPTKQSVSYSAREVSLQPDSGDTSDQCLPNVASTQQRYWNEYDDGSEAGDYECDQGYIIYVNQDQSANLVNFRSIFNAVSGPMSRVKAWVLRNKPEQQLDQEQQHHHQPLLSESSISSTTNYGTTDRPLTPETTETTDHSDQHPSPTFDSASTAFDDTTDADQTSADEEDPLVTTFQPRRPPHSTLFRPTNNYASSSEEDFPSGYDTYYAATHALPSLAEQRRMHHYRERMLFFGTLACFTTAFLLVGISTVLMATGRHRLRAEVDAGVTLGVVFGLGCACCGLAMMKARKDVVDGLSRAAVWAAFGAVGVLSGVLLVLVMGNSG